MKRFFPLYICTILVLLYSCNKVHPDEVLCQAEDIVSQCPDSALQLLNEISSPRSLKNGDKARYGWIKGLAHHKNKQSLIDDNLILFSLDYYKTHRDTAKLLRVYKLASLYHFANDEFEKGYSILDEAIEVSCELRDSTETAYFHLLKGLRHLDKGQSEEAKRNFKMSLQYKENADPYYVIGLRLAGKDSVEYYMDKSVSVALRNNDSISAAHYLRNYGQMLYGWGNYEKSIQGLHQAMNLSSYIFSPALVLSQNFLQLGKLDSAQYYLEMAKDNRLLLANRQAVLTRENAIAQIQSVIDYTLHKTYNDTKIAQYNDSVYFAMQNQHDLLLARMETKYNLEKENMQLVISRQQSQLWIIISSVFVLILIGGILLYTHNKKQKLLEAEEKNETLNRLLKEVTENVNDEYDSRFFKKILLQQLGLIRLIAAVPTSANQELLKQMANISNNDVPTDSLLAWGDLYPIIDSIYEGFYSKLVKQYGDILIEKEIQLCCLLRAEFSTKEINAVTQQSLHTIYQRKTTIRKKLKIEENKDIISFLRLQFQA